MIVTSAADDTSVGTWTLGCHDMICLNPAIVLKVGKLGKFDMKSLSRQSTGRILPDLFA